MRQSNKKWTALLVTVLFLWSGLAGAALAADGKVLSEVAGFLKENYVDPVPAQVLQAPTVDEMLKRLGDPYAQYYTKQEFENEMDVLNGEFMGIGVYFTPGKEGAEIFQLIKGSPAERAGIKKGDIITMAAGQSLAGMDKDAIAQIIKGPAGSVVQLKVKRGPNSITMAVTREKVTIPSVESEILGNNTGYIILREFGSHSADDIDKAIKSLEAKKAENWILDLRGNPGGFLEAAIDIAGDFMGTADTLIVEERSKKEMYQGNPGGHVVDGPMVVLIDENSASASEILSAALQDNQRAVIIGKKSYGKGTVQQIFDLSNEDKVKFTVARFYSPLGNVINKQGVKPDIEVGDDEARLAAELLLYDPPAGYKGKLLKLDTENFQATIDPVRARSAGFWKAWRSIIKGAAGNKFYAGTDNTAWTEISQEERESLWPLFYPDYKTNGPIVTVKPDSELKISLADDVNPRYINFSTVELIKADSGQRVKAGFTVVNKKDIAVKPAAKLTPGEYWLVLHDTIRFSSGQNIGQGIVAKYDVSK